MTVDTIQTVMEICSVLFLARVFGHIYVLYRSPSWLPPFDHWYSGTISYRSVFITQMCMLSIGLFGLLDVWYVLGIFGHPFWRAICPTMIVLCYIYFGGMIFRYIWTMARKPERRWFKRTIPIWAHMLVAIYNYCLCHFILATYPL